MEQEEDFKILTQKCAALQALLGSATVGKQELEVKLRELEGKYSERVMMHEQDLRDLKGDIDYLTQQNKELRTSLGVFKENDEGKEMQDKFRMLSGLYEKNLSILASHEAYIGQIESQNLVFSDQLEKVLYNNARLEEQKKRLTDENTVLRQKNKDFKETLERVTREAEKVIMEHVKREDSRKNQQDEYMSIVKKHSGLTKRYQDLQANYEKLEKDLASKNERINSVRQSKLIVDNKLKEEEKKLEDMNKRVKSLENSLKVFRRPDVSGDVGSEYEIKLAESERKLQVLVEKIDPLVKRNGQLEKCIEKQNTQIGYLKGIQKDLNSTITFLNLELEDYRKGGSTLISPKPSIRKSQLSAFQSSSGYAKEYRMDPSRFSPLKQEFSEMEGMDMERNMEDRLVFNTSEFPSNL